MLFKAHPPHNITRHSNSCLKLTIANDLCIKFLISLLMLTTCYGLIHSTRISGVWRQQPGQPNQRSRLPVVRNGIRQVSPNYRQFWTTDRSYLFKRNSMSKIGNRLLKNSDKLKSCDSAQRFLNKIELLILSGRRNKNLTYFHKYWRKILENCKRKRQWKNMQIRRVGASSAAQPESNDNIGLIALTGLGGILTTLLWLFIVAIHQPTQLKPLKTAERPDRRQITQLHIYPPSSEESSENEKSEESDKKKAAVGVGLAREILAINAESIHLSAHILEFLFILTKLARVVGRLGLPVPVPAAPGQLLTPAQAHEFLQILENNYNTTKILSNITSSGFKNPLKFLGNDISGSGIFSSAFSNPAASLALNKLLAGYNQNSTTGISSIHKISNKILGNKNTIFSGG